MSDDEFTEWENLRFGLGGIFVLLLPAILLALAVAFALDWLT